MRRLPLASFPPTVTGLALVHQPCERARAAESAHVLRGEEVDGLVESDGEVVSLWPVGETWELRLELRDESLTLEQCFSNLSLQAPLCKIFNHSTSSHDV